MTLKSFLLLLLPVTLWISSCQNQAATPSASTTTILNPEKIKAELIASTEGWNQGNLTHFMATYDSAATFMTGNGLIHLAELRQHYEQKYFAGNQPRQKLAFDELDVKPLGTDYALVTGKFILTGNQEPTQSGRFSLIFRATKNGWKILHDHSS